MPRLAVPLAVLVLVLAACGEDDPEPDAPPPATVEVGAPLPVGGTYEDPAGVVTMTLHGIRITGGLLLADAEACISADGPDGVPIEPTAWRLRVRGREQALTPTVLESPQRAARPPWPATVQIDSGECFRGKVAFEVPSGVRPAELIFAQLAVPARWEIRG